MTAPTAPRIVIDTNVLVAALRSRQGWSYRLLAQVGTGHFEHVLTVPLVLEYEDVLLRPGVVPVPARAVGAVIDFLCSSGVCRKVHFLWRPKLKDVKDDLVLEAAVNGACQAIVTWNVRDFQLATGLGLRVLTPPQFLQDLQEPPPS